MVVDPDGAGLDLRDQLHHSAQVIAPEAGGQAVAAVVDHLQPLFEGVVGHHGQHRAEDLFLNAGHALLHVGEHGRGDEVARQIHGLAASGEARTFAASDLQVIEHAALLLLRHQRADLGGGVHAGTDAQRADLGAERLDEAPVVARRYIDARGRRTDLALVEQPAADGAGHGLVDVGIFQQQHGVLAAQFEGEARHVLQRGDAHLLADGGGAGEGHLVHQRMRHQRRADLGTTADQHVEHPGGDAGFDRQLGQAQGSQRGFVSRLDDHGAAAGQRRDDLPQGNHHREVPRHDARYHARRLTAGVGIEARVLRHGDGHVERLAFDLGGPAGHVAHVVERGADFNGARQVDRLALVEGFQLGQLFAVGFDQIGEAQQDAFTRGRRQLAPAARGEGAMGRGDDGLHRRCVGQLQLGQHLRVRRVENLHPLAMPEAGLRAIDKGAVTLAQKAFDDGEGGYE